MADNETALVVAQSQEVSEPRRMIVHFNPNDHIIQIPNKQKKSDYLPVAWRLVWFRTLCPTGTIETEVVTIDLDRETEEETYAWNSETRRSEMVVKRANGIAIFRATVKDGKGGIATATKTEKAASFGDFIEKAETGAVGRALAMLGYGTQFAEVEFDEGERVVDSPVERRNPSAQEQKAYQERKPIVEADKPASNGHKPEQHDARPSSAPQHEPTGGPAPETLDLGKIRTMAFKRGIKSKDEWQTWNAKFFGSFIPDEKLKNSEGDLLLAFEELKKLPETNGK